MSQRKRIRKAVFPVAGLGTRFLPATKSIPLDATLIKGSHGAPVRENYQRTVMLSSEPGLLPHHTAMRDTDVFGVVAKEFKLQ